MPIVGTAPAAIVEPETQRGEVVSPVEVANPIQRLSAKDGVFDTVDVDEVAPRLMLATGLALRSG